MAGSLFTWFSHVYNEMEVKKRLFLGNLPDGASEKDIRKKFERFGSVSAVEIKYKKVNDGNESSTFAFVELSLSEDKFNECEYISFQNTQFLPH